MLSMARMQKNSMRFDHTPVLLNEVLDLLTNHGPKLVVDCTLGGAGHARAILERCPKTHLIGLDRDMDACSAARLHLEPFSERVRVVQERFSEIDNILDKVGCGVADALLVDLGVSSYQLDKADRGFAFRFDGPLDMRMDQSCGMNATEWIDSLSELELRDVIRKFGEERHARAIAREIKCQKPQTTTALAEIVRSIVPKGKSRVDVATRTFQGLRIKVNEEVDEIETWLKKLPDVVRPGGLVLAISYHSLEDRPIKRAFRHYAKACICPPTIPTCVCTHSATFKLITKKPLRPSDDEIARNPRSRSAKLRVVERLGASL